MIRRDFVQTAGLATGSVFAASFLRAVDALGMPNEDNHLQIATDVAFTNIVVEASGFVFLAQLVAELVAGQQYFWRQTRLVDDQHILVYHGRLLEVQSQDLTDLYNDELIPFIQEVSEEPVPPIPDTVVICHIPPDNPAAAHTREIGVPELTDHLAHGDHVGECTGEEGTGVVVEDAAELPDGFSLSQNYPNPFTAYTTIPFALPESARTQLTVFNLLGQHVETVMDTELAAGRHEVIWNASELSSGTYMMVLEAGTFRETQRIVLTK